MKPIVAVFFLAFIISTILATDEDFAFETSDDSGESTPFYTTDWNAPYQNFATPVGRIFHLAVPKNYFGERVLKFESKQINGKPLPSWLMFDKEDAIFWGVPLKENLGNLHLTIRSIGGAKTVIKNVIIEVVVASEPASVVKKCTASGDITFLTLVIDKRTEAIKPKQRVVAINDIAKFFGIPYSAFTLKPSDEQHDDITNDKSIILAGPGNVITRASTSASQLEVPVGCDGRLFPEFTTLVHQLKRQAKDGTISEVLGLPVFGWRVRINASKSRLRRQALDLGSGDYDGEYYDDYEEDRDDYEEEDTEKTATPDKDIITTTVQTTPKISTTISTTLPENTSTHPHRHHHGEPKKDDTMAIPVWTIVEDNSLNNEGVMIPITSPEVPKTPSTTLGSSTTAKSTTTSTTITITDKPGTTSTTAKTVSSIIPGNLDEDDYGDYKTDDYEEGDDDDIGEIESETIVPISNIVPETTTTSTVAPSTMSSTTSTTTVSTTTTTTPTTTTTTSTTPEPIIIKETTVPEEAFTIAETPVTTFNSDANKEFMPTTIPVTTVTETEATSPTTLVVVTTTTSTTTAAPTTTSATTTTTTTAATTTTTSIPTTTEMIEVDKELTTPTKLTTLRHVFSTSAPTTTEDDYETKNYPPYIENRLKRKNVIAGKIFRFVIPDDTFKDSEDNYDLKLEFLDGDENPITEDSWCQFNPIRREIYGLPLDDHVSKWDYVIRATDKEGASVQDRLTILVQQHKLQRVFNHEFSLEIRIEKREEFKHYIDWSLKTLRALGRIYNTNMSEITVRKVNYASQPVIFTWTNDSLPTSYCPKTEIEKLFKILTANDRGDPSRELNLVVAPELRIKKVSYHGMGVCEELNTPIAPPVNYPPILRNPVNHINATVGELLIFRVPKDTFYDPEDQDTLSLNLTLLTAERQEIPSHNWLQFDSKNREFFGIPRKTSRSEYQLVCVDSGGLPVIDSLEVVVYPAPRVTYNVEFSMSIETNYDKFINSATLQKKFVEKLINIFGDRNSSHIHFLPFKQKQHSTIATWFNKSLTTEKCPQDEIARLESIMKNEERGISNRVHAIMEPDFQVSTIKVLPMANCKIQKPKYVPKTPDDRIIIDESTQTTSSSDEYMLTFIIPVVVISVMTLFAAVAACVLYRRRRTGKMNVVEEGRQSYGNKGIPVIFQEELDEKPEAGTKAPVILKDEKPPLAPPEYSKSGSLKFNDDSEPYHPPPPFARAPDNGKQTRPKPAPTYRKPPPYVPP